jgi:hypothetical protein
MAPGPTASCTEANKVLYIRSELDGLVSYDLAKGAWSMYMDAPPGDCDNYLRSVAAWQRRLVDVTVALKERSITLNPKPLAPHAPASSIPTAACLTQNSALPCNNSLFRGYGYLNRLLSRRHHLQTLSLVQALGTITSFKP